MAKVISSSLRDGLISHTFIIKDDEVNKYLQGCMIPADAKDVELNERLKHTIVYPASSMIDHYITIDGATSTVQLKEGFPSSLLTFFQFGSLLIKQEDLDEIAGKPFVSPGDIKKLKEIERDKFVLPVKNVRMQGTMDFRNIVRKVIQDFFRKTNSGGSSMLDTLDWFIFRGYDPGGAPGVFVLNSCPHCRTSEIRLERDKMDLSRYSWSCTYEKCREEIYLTDVFRLFERVDEEAGAEAIVGHLRNVVESFLVVHAIKNILRLRKEELERILFVKEGPLSFGGDAHNMHRPMREMLNFLSKDHRINLVGVETSGPFVEHAKEIRDKLAPGELLLLDNAHIYKYIKAGNGHSQEYGRNNYYGGKMIYKSPDGRIYVLSMPVEDHLVYYNQPELSDLRNPAEVLMSIDRLRCDVYENALIPVAVVNKLISLSNRPGVDLLEKFAKKSLQS